MFSKTSDLNVSLSFYLKQNLFSREAETVESKKVSYYTVITSRYLISIQVLSECVGKMSPVEKGGGSTLPSDPRWRRGGRRPPDL